MPRPNTVPERNTTTAADAANRHPVDQLADVRAEIRTLKGREDELRDAILGGECSGVGDQYVARIDTREKRTLDVDLLTQHFGADTLKPFFKIGTVTSVRIAERQSQQEG
jgi:hypothetical protein